MNTILKRILAVTALCSFCLGAGGCSGRTAVATTTAEAATTTILLEYEDFAELFITDKAMQMSMPETDYYIYFYGRYCDHCQEIKNIVLATIQELESDKVYIVIVDYSDDIHDDIAVTGVPAIVHILDHEVATIYQNKTNVLVQLENLE